MLLSGFRDYFVNNSSLVQQEIVSPLLSLLLMIGQEKKTSRCLQRDVSAKKI